ncbi:MAG: hypothetical protein IJM84_00260 [Bacteroidaceae bacterium]|nr:hypothetical protein [Bacteroidaceae bacterium]
MRQLKFSNHHVAMRQDVMRHAAIHHVIAAQFHRVIVGMHHLLHVIADLCHRATEHIADHITVLITHVQE